MGRCFHCSGRPLQNHTLSESSAGVEKCEESLFHTPGQTNWENQEGFGPVEERGGVGGGEGGGGLQGLAIQVWTINLFLQD